MLIYVACGNGPFHYKISVRIREVLIMLNENIKKLRKAKGLGRDFRGLGSISRASGRKMLKKQNGFLTG